MRKRRLRVAIGVPLLIGSLNFMNIDFDAIRTVHVIQLLATGMCFGAALAALIGLLRSGD